MRYLILVLLLTSCGLNPKTALEASVKAVYVDELIRSGAVLDAAINTNMPEEDVQVISTALRTYNDFKQVWGDKIKADPLKLMTDLATFQLAYSRLRIQYEYVEEAVYRNWGNYSPMTQDVLKNYQSRAVELDKLVMTLINEGKTTTAIIAIEEAAVVIGRIALAVL